MGLVTTLLLSLEAPNKQRMGSLSMEPHYSDINLNLADQSNI